MFIELDKIDKVVFSNYTLDTSKGESDPEVNYCDTITGKACSWNGRPILMQEENALEI